LTWLSYVSTWTRALIDVVVLCQYLDKSTDWRGCFISVPGQEHWLTWLSYVSTWTRALIDVVVLCQYLDKSTDWCGCLVSVPGQEHWLTWLSCVRTWTRALIDVVVFFQYLDKIGQLFFGVPPPKSPSGSGFLGKYFLMEHLAFLFNQTFP